MTWPPGLPGRLQAAGLLLLACLLPCSSGFGPRRRGEHLAYGDSMGLALLAQIAEDLKPWADSGITLAMVERAYCSNFVRSFRLQIIGGEVFIVGQVPAYHDWHRYVKLQILDVARHDRLPDLDLVLTDSDECPDAGAHFAGDHARCPHLAPVLAHDKTEEQRHCVLYPDFTFAGWPDAYMPAWPDVRSLMAPEIRSLEWTGKRDTLFFRGAGTGVRGIIMRDATFKDAPDIDAQTIEWQQHPDKFVSIPEHCQHRYLLHLPGVSYSARLKYLLLCNSTVLFPYKGAAEFWYHLLEDGVNVRLLEPVTEARGGSHIVAALRELQADEGAAEAMAMAGHDLVTHALHPDNIRRYWAELLTQYAALQRFTPQKHPDAVPLAVSLMRPDTNSHFSLRSCDLEGSVCGRI